MQFFIPMQPPTTTHNAKQLHAFMRGGKPCAVLHDSPELKATRAKLHAYLAPYAPPTPCSGPVRLLVKWLFPTDGRHNDGEWRTTKPDTDNLEKALKDEMTRCIPAERMTPDELRQLHRLAIERRPEACLGCGLEHNCFVYGHGCAVIRKALRLLGGGADACL